jgi:predicted exporter
VGLITGCGCVLCLYPVLGSAGDKPPPALGARIGISIDQFLANWRWSKARSMVIALIGLIALLGLPRIHIQDDIRALQQSPADLLRDEQRVRDLLASSTETRFFVVTGNDEQALLSNERALTKQLDALIAKGGLSSYQALSKSLPTLAEQEAAHALLAEKVYSPQGLLPQVMRTLGFADGAIAQRIHQYSNSTPLTPKQWLESPASEGLNHLWLGQIGSGNINPGNDGRYASVVTLGGVNDVAALNQVADNIDIRLIDRVASTTEILGKYRRTMSLLLVLIYLVAGMVLTTRFGWRDAPRMLLPSALATAITLGLFGWLGVPVNLFTLLALWLVLGMGIDYGIFLRHGATSRPTAILSVTLSACTTLLAFGLLAFSATPFIRSIGLTLLCAIMLSWLIVLFSCLTGDQNSVRHPS